GGDLAHADTSLALGVRPRGRTVLTDLLAISLMGTPRWRSESALAGALYLLIRSQARSCAPHLRVERAVHDVEEHVDDYHEHGEVQRDPLDHRDVMLAGRGHRHAPQAGQHE